MNETQRVGRRRQLPLWWLIPLAGCIEVAQLGVDGGTPVTPVEDAGDDAGQDAGLLDAGGPTNDAGSADAGPVWTVTTFAGSGDVGYLDGPALTAEFSSPEGLAFDALGSLYVADSANNCVRKIDPQGTVSAVAGACGQPSGYVEGTGPSALFSGPGRLVVESTGRVYVTDVGNSCVRAISSTGETSSVAGVCTLAGASCADGALKGLFAAIPAPLGLALDETDQRLFVSTALSTA